jgi:hypothetical protein
MQVQAYVHWWLTTGKGQNSNGEVGELNVVGAFPCLNSFKIPRSVLFLPIARQDENEWVC